MRKNLVTIVAFLLLLLGGALHLWAMLTYGGVHWETHLGNGVFTVMSMLLLSNRFEQEPLVRAIPGLFPYNPFWRTVVTLGFVGLAVVTTNIGLGTILWSVYSMTGMVALNLVFGIHW